jgi:hypothetical protein
MAEHLTILEPDEIYDLYSIPVFDKDQQMLFFDLPEVEQKAILHLFDYRVADPNIRDRLMARACRLATRHSKPVYIFRELITYTEQNRIVLPAYTTMQRLIERALSAERKRLESLVGNLLKEDQQKLLENLLQDQRFCKKQQMQWTKKGAHLMLVARSKVLNGELVDCFKKWYPNLKIEEHERKKAA